MLDLAKHIVEQKSGHFDPDKFEDHYEWALHLQKNQSGQPMRKLPRAPAATSSWMLCGPA
jgi:DNA end-binding protein Ku